MLQRDFSVHSYKTLKLGTRFKVPSNTISVIYLNSVLMLLDV